MAAATRPQSIRYPATPPVAARSVGKTDVAGPAPDISRAGERNLPSAPAPDRSPGSVVCRLAKLLISNPGAGQKEKRQGHLRNHEHDPADDATRVLRRRGFLPAKRHSRPVASPAAPARARREVCSRLPRSRVKKPTGALICSSLSRGRSCGPKVRSRSTLHQASRSPPAAPNNARRQTFSEELPNEPAP